MGDLAALEKDALHFARVAVECDGRGDYDQAKFFYMEAAQALLSCKLAGSTKPLVTDKANEYILRCEQLASILEEKYTHNHQMKSETAIKMERAEFLLKQALDLDEAGQQDDAVKLYMKSAELCLELRKMDSDPANSGKFDRLAQNAIERAEEIKNVTRTANASKPKPANNLLPFRPLGDALRDSTSPKPSRRVMAGASGGSYTQEEIAVLRTTSTINGRAYLPFLDYDLKEKFAYLIPYEEKEKLALSDKQRENFRCWVRPDQFLDNPQMIMAVSSFSVKQTIVSDCSFVASLAISAQYERKFNRRLITSIIYPQSRTGDPVYNPCGKYMIKLHINGVPRKVIIDDYLPMGTDGRLLCSFSSNHNELWVSMLEKAYMKVMGGYDFPGSNSNIDLHALTGWIPERVAIKSSAKPFDKQREFQKIMTKFHQGDCVVTVATGALPAEEADRAGLVVSHAYAMLDIRELHGTKLLMLKNPWSHLRWKGRFSEIDTASWTPQLRRDLNYDPAKAQKLDNGVFWIDYDSFCHFFECIYINWRPDLFGYTMGIHHTWTSKDGPVKDIYNISDNPQYRLELKNNSGSPAAVWILLTRHITDKADFADNKEFITVFVYKGGERVYYPYDPAPYIDGVKINSPHYLCKMVETGNQVFTLVISQYEKRNTTHFTLRIYSQCEFLFNKISDPYTRERELTGEWKGQTAGGCSNHPHSYRNNPIYQVSIDNSAANNFLLVELLAPRQYNVGLEAVQVKINCPTAASGKYRSGYCILRLDNISGGVYNIIPSTFSPGEQGPFKLIFSSSCPISITKLQ